MFWQTDLDFPAFWQAHLAPRYVSQAWPTLSNAAPHSLYTMNCVIDNSFFLNFWKFARDFFIIQISSHFIICVSLFYIQIQHVSKYFHFLLESKAFFIFFVFCWQQQMFYKRGWTYSNNCCKWSGLKYWWLHIRHRSIGTSTF